MTTPLLFAIRPVSMESGFELSASSGMRRASRHPRLFDAILHAIRIGNGAAARIQIFDCDGRVADTLPLPARVSRPLALRK